jgi:hypothetical protein
MEKLIKYAKFLYCSVLCTKGGFNLSFEDFFESYCDLGERDYNAANALVYYFYENVNLVVKRENILLTFCSVSGKDLTDIVEGHPCRLKSNTGYKTFYLYLKELGKEYLPSIKKKKIVFPDFPIEIGLRNTDVLVIKTLPRTYTVGKKRKSKGKNIPLLKIHLDAVDKLFDLLKEKGDVCRDVIASSTQTHNLTKFRAVFVGTFFKLFPRFNEQSIAPLLKKDPDTILYYKNIHESNMRHKNILYMSILNFVFEGMGLEKV